MSTGYRLFNRESALPKAELLSKLGPLGVREAQDAEATDDRFPISDGTNYLWCFAGEDGRIADFASFGDLRNNPERICDALEEVCEDVMLSEHDEGFYEDEDEDDEGA